MTRRKTYPAEGKDLTIPQWAAELGVSRQYIHKLIKDTGSPLGSRRKPTKTYPSADGREATIASWATALQLSEDAIRDRIRKHGDPTKARALGRPKHV